MKKKTKKNIRRRKQFPVIGKYIDARTKAELNVIDFFDDVGTFKFSSDGLTTTLKGCRFQLTFGNVKSKRKFYKLLQPYLDYTYGYESGMDFEPSFQRPLLFGLLKIRKRKVRKFIMFESATQVHKIVSVVAATIDNLLYLELLAKAKNIP